MPSPPEPDVVEITIGDGRRVRAVPGTTVRRLPPCNLPPWPDLTVAGRSPWELLRGRVLRTPTLDFDPFGDL